MMNTHLENRQARYYTLSSRLATIDHKQLALLLSDSGPKQGWGATHTIKVNSSKVFVKRIPLTELEYDTMFSTENLYGMPTFYNYGVGSAGFGAFRELVAHIKTTNWVLDGSAANFPLMYHYRIQPVAGQRPDLDGDRHAKYVKYWGSDPNIDRYIRARNTAKYEVLLFLEHFPHVLHHWLAKNGDKSATIIREMAKTLTFLRDQGTVHFDVHFANILVDGERPYLTDFGLVLDKSFALDAQEQTFFRKHADYDSAEFLACLGSYLPTIYQSLSVSAKRRIMRRYGFDEKIGFVDLVALLQTKIDEIKADGLMPPDDDFVSTIVKHQELILTMYQFYRRLRENEKKDTPYPYARIRRLLKETPFQ